MVKRCNNVRERRKFAQFAVAIFTFKVYPVYNIMLHSFFIELMFSTTLQDGGNERRYEARGKSSFLIFWIINMMFYNEQGVNNSICWANIHVKDGLLLLADATRYDGGNKGWQKLQSDVLVEKITWEKIAESFLSSLMI